MVYLSSFPFRVAWIYNDNDFRRGTTGFSFICQIIFAGRLQSLVFSYPLLNANV